MSLNNNITQNKFKTSIGTWIVVMDLGTVASIHLLDYCFFPKQAASVANSINSWYPYILGTTERHTIFAYANNAAMWLGTYRYISFSEQIVEVYRNNKGKVISIHVTENGNMNSIKIYNVMRYDTMKKEIPLILETMNFKTHFHLFKNKQCIKSASELYKIL